MQQFSFDFPVPTDYASSDFILSDANRAAYTWVSAWPEWSTYGLVIYGPPDCGKTHLAYMWKEKTQATLLQAASLTEELLPEFLQKKPYYLIENIERIDEEPVLFHLLNHVKEQNGAILLTALKAPNQLNFSLPDLRSRINALPAVNITSPDDTLLKALLLKQFTDRQIRVSEDIVEFLLSRIERSFAMVKYVVDTLDKKALQENCKVTIPFVKKALEKM